MSNKIIKGEYDVDWNSFKKEILNTRKSNYSHYTSDTDQYNYIWDWKHQDNLYLENIEKYHSYIQPYIDDYFYNILNYTKDKKLKIKRCWLLNYKKDGYVTEHTHSAGNILVACLYLEKKSNEKNIEFFNETNNTWESFNTKTNDFIIFFGNHPHRTKKDNTDSERWMISTNYFIEENKTLL